MCESPYGDRGVGGTRRFCRRQKMRSGPCSRGQRNSRSSLSLGRSILVGRSLGGELFGEGEIGHAGDGGVVTDRHLIAAVALHINAGGVIRLALVGLLA